MNICPSCPSFHQHFSNNTNHGSNDNNNSNNCGRIYDIKQQQQHPPPLHPHHNKYEAMCAKCGDIHSAFNGNGNYCKSAQPFELYLCINMYMYTCVCIVCTVLLRYIEPLNSVAIRTSSSYYQQSTVCSSHDRFRKRLLLHPFRS